MEIPQELIDRFKVFNIELDNKKILEILTKEVDSLETPPTFYQLFSWSERMEIGCKEIFTSFKEAEQMADDILDERYNDDYCEISEYTGTKLETIMTKRGTKGKPPRRPDTPEY